MFNMKTTQNLNIRTKLVAGFLVMVALTIILGVIATIQLRIVQKAVGASAESFEITSAQARFETALLLYGDIATEYALGDVYAPEELGAEFADAQATLSAAHDEWMALIGMAFGEDQGMSMGDGSDSMAMDGLHSAIDAYEAAATMMMAERDGLRTVETDFAAGTAAIKAQRKALQNIFWDQGYTDLELAFRTMGYHEKEFLFQYRSDELLQEVEGDADALGTAIAGSDLPDEAKAEGAAAIDGYKQVLSEQANLVILEFDARQGAINDAMQVFDAAREDLLQIVDGAVQTQEALVASNVARLNKAVNTANYVIIGAGAAAVIVGLMLALVLAQALAKPLAMLTQAATRLAEEDLPRLAQGIQAVANGDLTRRVAFNAQELTVKSGDEVGQVTQAFNVVIGRLKETGAAFGQMVVGLRNLAGQTNDGANNVTSSATEILAASSQMATITQQQASVVSQVTSTVEEIRASAEQVAQRAQGVADAAAAAANAAQKGSSAVTETTSAMEDIRQKVESIAENILSLSEQMQQIGNIIDTVTDIADQSNILALNAAIEAAQAGEAGKGFRVVADEVRSLSDQSRQAAGQVKTILGDIQKATNLAVMATEQGTKGVDAGALLVGRTASTIQELAGTAETSSQVAQQIVASVQQQTVGLDQIAIGMGDINQATQQTAVGARQSEESAESLSQLAARLKNTVAQYQI